MFLKRQSVDFIHKKHISPNQSVVAAWFLTTLWRQDAVRVVSPLQTQTAAEQQLRENNVSARSDCVKTEDPEDTNKKVHYLKVSTCVLMIKSWRAETMFSSQHNQRTSNATRVQYLVSGVTLDL